MMQNKFLNLSSKKLQLKLSKLDQDNTDNSKLRRHSNKIVNITADKEKN